jgi:hypothetical protein
LKITCLDYLAEHAKVCVCEVSRLLCDVYPATARRAWGMGWGGGGVVAGCWLLAAGCWLLAVGSWLLAALLS